MKKSEFIQWIFEMVIIMLLVLLTGVIIASVTLQYSQSNFESEPPDAFEQTLIDHGKPMQVTEWTKMEDSPGGKYHAVFCDVLPIEVNGSRVHCYGVVESGTNRTE